ncbi:hypothetical protein M8J76_014073 [Diaphorina citri]|nr:hypothetical protein M8J76_014073 [Diaphorina citri]
MLQALQCKTLVTKNLHSAQSSPFPTSSNFSTTTRSFLASQPPQFTPFPRSTSQPALDLHPFPVFQPPNQFPLVILSFPSSASVSTSFPTSPSPPRLQSLLARLGETGRGRGVGSHGRAKLKNGLIGMWELKGRKVRDERQAREKRAEEGKRVAKGEKWEFAAWKTGEGGVVEFQFLKKVKIVLLLFIP